MLVVGRLHRPSKDARSKLIKLVLADLADALVFIHMVVSLQLLLMPHVSRVWKADSSSPTRTTCKCTFWC